MKLCITGGGTGGHLMIAETLEEAARELGVEAIFIGSTSGQDRKYFQNSDLFEKTYFLETSGVVNKKGFGKLKALWMIFKAFLQAKRLLKQHDIDALYSVGGFSAAPASFAAVFTKTPLFIHEQNARIGKLNSILRKYALEFISSYEENSPIKAYPVRDIFFEYARVRKKVKTVIFLGGSQGAKAINDLALKTAPALKEKNIAIIHQCGEHDYERVLQAYEAMGITADLFPFSKQIFKKMHQADLAVSRSGASTLWELAANGLPALFIPYPYAASDHQYYNAEYLLANDLAWLAREDDDPREKLLAILDEDLEEKSQKLQKLTHKGVAKEMIERVRKRLKR